jgi:hypothetical protein
MSINPDVIIYHQTGQPLRFFGLLRLAISRIPTCDKR